MINTKEIFKKFIYYVNPLPYLILKLSGIDQDKFQYKIYSSNYIITSIHFYILLFIISIIAAVISWYNNINSPFKIKLLFAIIAYLLGFFYLIIYFINTLFNKFKFLIEEDSTNKYNFLLNNQNMYIPKVKKNLNNPNNPPEGYFI